MTLLYHILINNSAKGFNVNVCLYLDVPPPLCLHPPELLLIDFNPVGELCLEKR